MPHPLYSPEIRDMLEQDDTAGLAALCEELHPATIADAIEDTLSADQIWQLLGSSDVRTQAAIFEYLPNELQIELMADPSRPLVAKLIEKMSHDDRVDLLKKLPKKVYESLLRLVDEVDRRDMKALFEYRENTVGAIMTTDYSWLSPTLTAAEAIDQLRAQAPDKETIYYIYVLDEAKKRADGGVAPRTLLGVISLRDLILAPRHALIRDLMEEEIVALQFTEDKSMAADLLARYDFIAVPVVDADNGMLGIVTHDDALDVVTQEATEDLQKQGGVSPIAGDFLQAGLRQVWQSRVVWLGVLFVAQMATVYAMDHYEGELKQVTVLATLIPLCLSVGGNAGSQASTLVTRALALEQVRVKDWLRVFRRELVVGAALAATLGILGLFRTYFFTPGTINQTPDQLLKLTWVIGISVTLICLWGTLLGAMLPIIIKKLGFDPALMSSPFIATLSDVSGIVIYFNVAWVFFFSNWFSVSP
jgi:magnesium transporter